VISPSWDPRQYERFATERARPFVDLVGQVPTPDPRTVVDLGCGPGTMTAILPERWPWARVRGLDSSPAMIDAAAALNRPGRLEFELGEIAAWRPAPESVDVIISNAALQWVPEHQALLPRWAAALRPGGTLAFQVPAPDSTPAGPVFRKVAAAPAWAARLEPIARAAGPQGASPVRPTMEYVDALAELGLTVNAWETTYLHVLAGDDAVLEWFAGTGLRPYLDALRDDTEATNLFRAEVADRLREAFPPREYGTVLSFRRIFVLGIRP
jgi:trans-aconitate 2-methyltransferase